MPPTRVGRWNKIAAMPSKKKAPWKDCQVGLVQDSPKNAMKAFIF